MVITLFYYPDLVVCNAVKTCCEIYIILIYIFYEIYFLYPYLQRMKKELDLKMQFLHLDVMTPNLRKFTYYFSFVFPVGKERKFRKNRCHIVKDLIYERESW